MAARYQLRLKNSLGAVVAVTDRFERLAYTKRVNTPGFYALQTFDGNPFLDDLDLDYQLEVWRRDQAAGIDWYLDFEAFHRTLVRQRNQAGKAIIICYGAGYEDLLARRIIEGGLGIADTEKNGPAETVIKEFVDEQAGPSAAVARQTTGLSVEVDGGLGNLIDMSRAWRNLLEVCQEIALIGGGDFSLVGIDPPPSFEFRWHDGQLGDDRRVGTSTPVVFALGFGNMAIPVYSLARTDEVDYVYVGGQGEGVLRNVNEVWNVTAIADSPWNRREVFVDARNEDTDPALDSKGYKILEEKQAQESISFDVIQTAACLYGRDYFLGDLVTARYDDIQVNKKIVGVNIVIQGNREQVDLELADVP